MIYANDENFKETINKNKLILLDFFATWCMPCKMQSEVLDKIDKSRVGDVEIIKVNVDEAPTTAREYEIESIPTLVLIQNGKILKRIVGYTDENDLINIITGI